MDDKNCDIAHERELRELWQVSHEERHDLGQKELDRRLGDMNQLREQLDSERGVFLRREVYDKEHDALRDTLSTKIDANYTSSDVRFKVLENAKANLEGRMWAVGAMTGAIVTLINVALHFFWSR